MEEKKIGAVELLFRFRKFLFLRQKRNLPQGRRGKRGSIQKKKGSSQESWSYIHDSREEEEGESR